MTLFLIENWNNCLTVFWTFEEKNFESKFWIIFWIKYWRNFSGLFCRLHMESYCRNIVWTKFLHNILYQIINTSIIYDQLKSKDPNPAKSGSIKHKVHNSISINKELARFSLVHTKLNLELWCLADPPLVGSALDLLLCVRACVCLSVC